jgi:hypothetical protein
VGFDASILSVKPISPPREEETYANGSSTLRLACPVVFMTPVSRAVRVVPRWYKDSIMGPSQKWIHERSFAEDLVSRWAKSIVDSEKEFF